jgi:signal peptidase II
MSRDPTEPVPPAGIDAPTLDAPSSSGVASPSALPLASDAPQASLASEVPAPFSAVPAPSSMRPSHSPSQSPEGRPTFLFLGVVAAISLVADVTSKAWAEIVLSKRTLVDPAIVLIPDHLSFTLARNRGGAWGLLENASEMVRRPFFLLVSGLAIAFIVSLYGRLGSGQRALKWGLPLVLGGALGNLSDRIIRSSVIDFIDFRANWVESMNRAIFKVVKGWGVTDHWPTFNVADVSICIGVGLMALDMFVSKRGQLAPVSSRLAPEPALSTGPSSKPPSV